MSEMSESGNFAIGLSLALSSCLFIGVSFIIKKIGLMRLSSRGLRAANGGYGYLRDWVWWTGLTCMAIGELANFTAYTFAPASLVTPLGALSVLVSSVFANRYLNERLNLLAKIGCLLCIIGATIIVIHAPKDRQIESLDELSLMLVDPSFVCYLVFVSFTTFLLMAVYAPRYGSQNVIIYILICSLIGSLSVMSCKGLGLAIRQTLSQTNQLTNILFWILLLSVVATVSIQMNYLNKSLDIFDTSVVTPIYYVFFTTFVIIASAILFKEWRSMSFTDVIGSLCGFSTVIIAIFLLNAFKDYNITFANLRSHWLIQRSNSVNYIRDDMEIKLLAPDMKCDISPGLITWTAADDEC